MRRRQKARRLRLSVPPHHHDAICRQPSTAHKRAEEFIFLVYVLLESGGIYFFDQCDRASNRDWSPFPQFCKPTTTYTQVSQRTTHPSTGWLQEREHEKKSVLVCLVSMCSFELGAGLGIHWRGANPWGEVGAFHFAWWREGGRNGGIVGFCHDALILFGVEDGVSNTLPPDVLHPIVLCINTLFSGSH